MMPDAAGSTAALRRSKSRKNAKVGRFRRLTALPVSPFGGPPAGGDQKGSLRSATGNRRGLAAAGDLMRPLTVVGAAALALVIHAVARSAVGRGETSSSSTPRPAADEITGSRRELALSQTSATGSSFNFNGEAWDYISLNSSTMSSIDTRSWFLPRLANYTCNASSSNTSNASSSIICTNTCNYASDSDCDDGGPGTEYNLCSPGTDCQDCGHLGDVSCSEPTNESPLCHDRDESTWCATGNASEPG